MIPASYSFSWALSVVQQLKRKYPRATESVERILEIDDRNLATYLAKGDPLFPKLREAVHICAHMQEVSPFEYTDVSLSNDLRRYYRNKGWERIAARLDSIENRTKLKEQESRGGS